jgi:hypothetical protein
VDWAILSAARAAFFRDLVVVLIPDSIQEPSRWRKSEMEEIITFESFSTEHS